MSRCCGLRLNRCCWGALGTELQGAFCIRPSPTIHYKLIVGDGVSQCDLSWLHAVYLVILVVAVSDTQLSGTMKRCQLK